MADKLEVLLEFVRFTHDIREVERAVWVRGREQFENDSEHGYQLAMLALYLIEVEGLQLDPYKTMALAVAHDIIEVYSGDTPLFGDASQHVTKADREVMAVGELKKRWPQLKRLHELVEEYELRVTSEAKFVYALDKLAPMLNNYLDHGRNWRREDLTLDQVIAAKAGKIDTDPDVKAYYEQLLAVLRQHPELFRA